MAGKARKVHTEILTGIRPTGDLTLGNYLGAIKPVIDLQRGARNGLVFVADLHGLTDQEPATVAAHRYGLVGDLLALGLDTAKTGIFIQSAIRSQVLLLTMLLSRHETLAELMRVPALKDKLKDPKRPEQATFMLANYPVMMAADILLQGSEYVPVGDDQVAHLEFIRVLIRRFNTRYGEVFTEPKAQPMGKPLRIMALDGSGKMSKSNPKGAILLSDSAAAVTRKLKRAVTANPGELNDTLRSHFTLARELAAAGTTAKGEAAAVDRLERRHRAGEKVMGEFKALLGQRIIRFLDDYATAKQDLAARPEKLRTLVKQGNETATANANTVIASVLAATGFKIE